MISLTEMSSKQLAIVESQIGIDTRRAVDKELDKCVTSLGAPLQFGKHKEKSLNQVIQLEPTYVEWLLRETPQYIHLNKKDMKILKNVVKVQKLQRTQDAISELKDKEKKLIKEIAS